MLASILMMVYLKFAKNNEEAGMHRILIFLLFSASLLNAQTPLFEKPWSQRIANYDIKVTLDDSAKTTTPVTVGPADSVLIRALSVLCRSVCGLALVQCSWGTGSPCGGAPAKCMSSGMVAGLERPLRSCRTGSIRMLRLRS